MSRVGPCRIMKIELHSTLKKILEFLQLWSREASEIEGRRAEIRKKARQLNTELDQIIKRIQRIRAKSIVLASHRYCLLILTQQRQFIGQGQELETRRLVNGSCKRSSWPNNAANVQGQNSSHTNANAR